MTKDEYDRKLKDVQEIEAQAGLKILTPFEFHADDGSIHEAGFSHNGRTVFRQEKPFTAEATYFVNEREWRSIVYADATR